MHRSGEATGQAETDATKKSVALPLYPARRRALFAGCAQLAKLTDSFGTQCLDEIRGLEGAGARSYFAAYCQDPERFNFTGRNRRPPRDPVNACLSFAYSLLTADARCTPAVGPQHRVLPSACLWSSLARQRDLVEIVSLCPSLACDAGRPLHFGHVSPAGAGQQTLQATRWGRVPRQRRPQPFFCLLGSAGWLAGSPASLPTRHDAALGVKFHNNFQQYRCNMPDRQCYLFAYDIRDPRRLRRALTILKDYAWGGQRSVFECFLTVAEKREMSMRVRAAINEDEDSLLAVRLPAHERPGPGHCLLAEGRAIVLCRVNSAMTTLYIDRKGASVSHDRARLWIRYAEEQQSVLVRSLDRVVITAGCQLDSRTLLMLNEAAVPVVILHPRKYTVTWCGGWHHGNTARRLANTNWPRTVNCAPLWRGNWSG